MNRRGFLGSILALGAAPAIVRADSLMRIIPRGLIVPPLEINMLPPPVFRGNRLLTIDEITREAMRILAESIEASTLAALRYDADFAKTGTLKVRLPNRYA